MSLHLGGGQVPLPFQLKKPKVWDEKGFQWIEVFAGCSNGGRIVFYNSACTKCFREFMKPQRHKCIPNVPDGIYKVTKKSEKWLKNLCVRMAHIANTESLYDFGIFGNHSWNGESASGISEGFFFLMFKNGKPVSYVIYNRLSEGFHIIHHAYTVPYERRKGNMEKLLRYSLPQIGENEFTVLHRAPMKKEMYELWHKKFGVDIQRISTYKYWFRFNKP